MALWILFCLPLFSVLFLTEVSALECYVCTNQTGNVEKCLNTIKTCEPGEDVCGTLVRWGSEPYFSQGALKQFYVSKSCQTKSACQKLRKTYMPYCTHIWYEDWSCAECCQGDRCNYFIISGASTMKMSFLFLAALLTLFWSIRKIAQS